MGRCGWGIFSLAIMRARYILILISSFCIGCSSANLNRDTNNVSVRKTNTTHESSGIETKSKHLETPQPFDTILHLFPNKDYRVEYCLFNRDEHNFENKNACLRLIFNKLGVDKILRADSLYCMYPDITLKDFNNDGTKDICLFYYNGGRANPTYYLYIVDTGHNNFHKVKGFENLPSPNGGTRPASPW